MTLKLTERDKKLLLVLVIVLLVVGLGVGVILPLSQKNQSLQEALSEAKIEQMEKEQKTALLSSMQTQKVQAEKNLAACQKKFYALMPSMEIDKMLTGMALSKNIVVNELNISLPETGEYTVLPSYEELLQQTAGGQTPGKENEASWGGIYTARVEITMSGSRKALQSMLDDCAASEPGMRVTEFLWQNNGDIQDGTCMLSVSLELYMAEDTQQYLEESRERADSEKTTETTEG